MQRIGRDLERQLSRWISALILAVLAFFFGRDHIPGGSRVPNGQLPSQVSGAGRPIDGDSLRVGSHEVRLKGIDAPEGRQTCTRDGKDWACGNASRDELVRLIGKDVVTCKVDSRDQHGRLLAFCRAGPRDLNAGMVTAGLALAYGGFMREEGEARARKRGLWASEFQRPRDWRQRHGLGH